MCRRTVLVFTALVVLTTPGCDRPAEQVVLPPSAARDAEDLGPGDVLEVRVAQEEKLTGTYQVAEDGSIRLPWIGKVKVAGRLPADVALDIETRLADGWLRQPDVTVLVAERQNREVAVLGQVKEPGSYPYKERLTLMQAISLAGGMNPLAQTRKVKLIRETDQGRQTFEIDVDQILDSRTADLTLEPGDIVFVPESPI